MDNKTHTITIKYGWREEMLSLILLLEAGNSEGKREARERLLELADQLDKHNDIINNQNK